MPSTRPSTLVGRECPAVLLACASALAACAVAHAGAPSPASPAGIAAKVLDRLVSLRTERGMRPLPRRAELDAAAEARAARIAALPMDRRLDVDEPIEALLRKRRIPRFARADLRLALMGGFADPGSAAVEQWRDASEPSILDPRWSAAGVGVARAGDGIVVIAVLLLEDLELPADLHPLERRTEAEVNEARRAHGLASLTGSEVLRGVARAHSEDMARRRYFAHLSPEGASAADRVRARGLEYVKIAENIATNQGTDDPVAAAVRGWLASPGHRANILDGSLLLTGVGVAVGDDGTFYFTQLFLEPAEERPPRRRSR